MPNNYIANDLTLTRKQITYGLVVLGIILVAIFGWLGWTNVYQNPERVFWDALSNNLATSGVTRHIVETAGSQKLDEYVQLELGSSNLVYSETTLSESTNTISTEVIGTPTTDYTRYTAARTAAKGANGQPLDFSKVLGVWSKTAASDASNVLDHLFGQSLLGIVPIANLPASERQKLVSQMHSVFVPNFSTTQRKVIDGQKVIVYTVQVQPAQYAALMQAFAKAEGLGTLGELNPSNYKGATALSLQLAISPTAHQLVQVKYSGGNHTEDYSGYGLQPAISLPTKTITAAALQQRLAAIQ